MDFELFRKYAFNTIPVWQVVMAELRDMGVDVLKRSSLLPHAVMLCNSSLTNTTL